MILETLDSFRSLDRDWNGYDAKPIPETIISRAKRFYELFEFKPDQVVPTGRETVQFEWYTFPESSDLSYIEIEVFEDRLESLYESSGSYAESPDGETEESIIQTFNDWMKNA